MRSGRLPRSDHAAPFGAKSDPLLLYEGTLYSSLESCEEIVNSDLPEAHLETEAKFGFLRSIDDKKEASRAIARTWISLFNGSTGTVCMPARHAR